VVWGGGNGYRDSANRVKDTRYWVTGFFTSIRQGTYKYKNTIN